MLLTYLGLILLEGDYGTYLGFDHQSWKPFNLRYTNARTATGMDGTLTLIFEKSETSRDIKKSF